MLRVKHITLVSEERNPVKEDCKGINLIIGANNTGKTTFLNSIFNELRYLHPHPPGANWTYGLKVTLQNAEGDLRKLFPNLFDRNDDFINYSSVNENIYAEGKKEEQAWSKQAHDHLRRALNEDFEYESDYGSIGQDKDTFHLFHFLTEKLVKIEDCINRINIPFNTTITNLSADSYNDFIFHIYKNRAVFKIIQQTLSKVYNLKIDFDNLQQGFKPLRIISTKLNKNIKNPFLLAEEWGKKTELLDTQIGHGIRAFLKLIFTVLHPSSKIILIDEPEMFIHPPQRRTLGKLIAKLAVAEKKQLFIATHDAEFMRGILSESGDIKVFKLYKKGNYHFYKTLASQEILSLTSKQTSNLLNERILNSFFYNKTVLCENENDRVFYEEAMAKYHWKKYHDINFVGFNGKDIAVVVYNKLRELGINPVLILDIDYLAHGQFPNINDNALRVKYKSIQRKFKELNFEGSNSEYNKFKKKGVGLLRTKQYSDLNTEVRTLISDFKKHQVYIVPVGEFESWTNSEKNDIPHALNKMRGKKLSSLDKFLDSIAKS